MSENETEPIVIDPPIEEVVDMDAVIEEEASDSEVVKTEVTE